MVDTKAGRFISSRDVLRLPLDSLVAWRVSSTHRDEDRDMAQLGQSTKNVANLFLSSIRRIPWCFEVVEQDKAGVFQGVEFRNNFFQSNLLISRYLQLDVKDFEENFRCRFNSRHPEKVLR